MLVKPGRRGAINLPKEPRADLDEHALFEAAQRDDGVIEPPPQAMIAARQAWF